MKINQNKKILLLTGLLFLFFSTIGKAQGIGHWRNYLSYFNTTTVIETPNRVFALASGALYSYTPDGKEIKKYSKIDGLNDLDITNIAYSESENALLIVYNNANMDIFSNSGIYNMPYFKDNISYNDKTINNIQVYGKFAYLSTSFGVLVIDLERKETHDVYHLEKNTYSICFHKDSVYVSTEGGIFSAQSSSKSLSHKEGWSPYNPGIAGLNVYSVNQLYSFQDALIFCQYNYGIFYKNESESGNLIYDTFLKIVVNNNQLTGISANSVHFWTNLNNHTVINDLKILDITGKRQNTFWIARGTEGIAAIQKNGNSNDYTVVQPNITVNSPKNNYTYELVFQQNKLLVTGGYRWGNRYNRPGTLMVLENEEWYNFDEKKIEAKVKEMYPVFQNVGINFTCADFIYSVVDPRDPNHYFVASYGEGMYEFKNNELVKLHFVDNSPLISTIADQPFEPYLYLRLGGLTFDSDNNLFVGNITEGRGSASKMYSKDGQWYDTGYLSDYIFYLVDKTMITSKNQKWMNFPRNTSKSPSGIFIVDDNGTPYNFSDDKKASFFGSIQDQKGETFSFLGCFSMAEDKKGTIWVGTDKGPILFYNPQNAIKNPGSFYCTRLILPYNDGTNEGYYLLENERINAIAVDGANRKWLGTQNSGVYLVSETGMEILEHYTIDNSPLLSNTVTSIAINPQSGEVFFATDRGLVSYLGSASEGKENYSEVHAYPNPVRPEYDNLVTITNLIKDSNVKITDAKGNLVYQGVSKGGLFTWNCVNKNGERVKTGVYLVFAATPEGGEGVVTKIMVIK